MPNQQSELALPGPGPAARKPTNFDNFLKVAARCARIRRQDGAHAMFHHLRVVVLYQLHTKVLDKLALRREPASASHYAALKNLTITGEHAGDATAYEPTPHLVLQWTMKLLPKDLHNWSFIDIGAGRGRVIAAAAQHAFRSVLGVEIAAELRRDARHHIESLPDGFIKAGEVRLVDADAVNFKRPAGPCVFYLYNPFNEKVLGKFMRNLIESGARQSERTLLAYYHPKQSHIMSGYPEVRKLELTLKARLAFALLSPFPLELYEIGGDANADQNAQTNS